MGGESLEPTLDQESERKLDESKKEQLLSQLKDLLEIGDTEQVEKVFNGNQDVVTEASYELIVLFCNAVTEENLASIPLLSKCIPKLVEAIAKQGNPKEIFLYLLEQVEGLKETSNDDRFVMLLKPIQTTLLRMTLPKRRKSGFSWAANTLYEYVSSIPLPKPHNLEKEERLLLESDQDVIRITHILSAVIEFYRPFVNELTVREWEAKALRNEELKVKRKHLAFYLLQLFERPLAMMDLAGNSDSSKSRVRCCAEQIVEFIGSVICDFFTLLIFLSDSEHSSSITESQHELGEGDKLDNRIEGRCKVSSISMGTLFYMSLAEGVCNKSLPCVYSKTYILDEIIPLCVTLLESNELYVIHKGLLLSKAIVGYLSTKSLPYTYLDNNAHIDFITAHINIMIYCSVQEFRQIALKFVPDYVYKFDEKGRYELFRCLLTRNTHPGVMGFLIGLVKNNVVKDLDEPNNCNCYFLDSNFKTLAKLIFVLPNGAETDLLENSDHILAALNFLRFLLLRDVKNVTGVTDCMIFIKEAFLEPLRLGLDLSKAHYELELKGIDEENKLNKKKRSEVMGDSRDVTAAALTTFDLIKCVLLRVEELC